MLDSLAEFDPSPNFLKIVWGDPHDPTHFPGLNDHQLALYHRVPLQYAQEMRKRKLLAPLKSWPRFKYVIDIGGVGSGKSFAGALILWMENLFFPGNFWVVIRKHHQELRNTIIKTFEEVGDMLTDGHKEWLMEEEPSKEDGAVEYLIVSPIARKPSKIIFRIEPDGDREKIEVAFRGPNQGGFLLEEMVQLQRFTWETQQERIRLPGTSMRGVGLSNPPDGSNHWVAQLREEAEKEYYEWIPWVGREDHPGASQKPRVLSLTSATEDNKTLPAEYVEDLKRKYENDPVGYSMFVLGKAGERTGGEGVFKNYFSYSQHVRENVKYNPYRTLYVGWDFGFRTPAAVFFQVDEEERVTVLAELIGHQQYIEAFCDDVQSFIQRKFPIRKAPIEHWGDIAGEQVKDTGSSIARAQSKGFFIKTADVGTVMEGVDIIRKMLAESRGGVNRAPRIVFHPSCTALIKAFAGGYAFKRMKDGRFTETPFKDNVNDHPVDAFRYGIVNIFGKTDSGSKGPQRGQLRARRSTRLGS